MLVDGCRYSLNRVWFARILMQSVLLGSLLTSVMYFWLRRSARKRIPFCVSCSNLALYSLWLIIVTSMFFLQAMPSICGVISYKFPAYIFFFAPFLMTIYSIPLCFFAVAADEGERKFPILVNALMAVLWAIAVVPPN